MTAVTVRLDGSHFAARAWCEECQQGKTSGWTGASRWAQVHNLEEHPTAEANAAILPGDAPQWPQVAVGLMPPAPLGWQWKVLTHPDRPLVLRVTLWNKVTLTYRSVSAEPTPGTVKAAAALLLELVEDQRGKTPDPVRITGRNTP